MSSTHQPTKQNTVWETGGQNWFIQSLNDAYVAVTQPVAKSTPVVKPGVEELFESDPELANEVYEVLGLDTTEEISLDDAVGNTYVITTPMEVLPDEVQSDYRGLDIGDIFTIAWDGEEFGVYLIEEDFKVNTGLMIDEKGELKPFSDAKSLGYKKLQNPYLSNLSLRKLKGLLSLSDAKEELVPKSKLTVEQKQQAQQQYGQYIQQTGRQDIEGFEKFVADTKLQLDIQNINVTFDMVKHFYDQSTTRKSFDAYSTEFAAYAANLKTTRMTNPEIIEKLKCL